MRAFSSCLALTIVLLGATCSSTPPALSVQVHLVSETPGTDTVTQSMIGSSDSFHLIELPFLKEQHILDAFVSKDDYIDTIYNFHLRTDDVGFRKFVNAWRSRSQFDLGITINDSLFIVADLIHEPTDSSFVFTDLNQEQLDFASSVGLARHDKVKS